MLVHKQLRCAADLSVSERLQIEYKKQQIRVVTDENQSFEILAKFRKLTLPWVYVCMYVRASHIARVRINRVRLPILLVVS